MGTPSVRTMMTDLLSPTEATDGRFRWEPSPLLLTPIRTLVGGAALGAAIRAIESRTGRPVIFAAAHYVSFSLGTEPLELDVTIESAGHYTSQARCAVRKDGREILTAYGAFGERPSGDNRVWSAMPSVSAPDECAPLRYLERFKDQLELGSGTYEFVEARSATSSAGDGFGTELGTGRFAVWLRCAGVGIRLVDGAQLAFFGDFMQLGYEGATGAPYAGNSLDNTIRVGAMHDCEWVLLCGQIQHVSRGFGYGHAEIWSDDGRLLASVSQSNVMRSQPPDPTARGRDRAMPGPRTDARSSNSSGTT